MKLTRHLVIAATLTGTLILAGCDSGDDPEQAAPNETTSQAEQSQETEQQASRTLQGKLEFSATETPLPKGAEVTVSLQDVTKADAPPISETTVIPEAGEPVEFALDYDASEVNADHPHILRAALRDGDGTLRWTTKERHTVEIGSDSEAGHITLVLKPVTSGGASDESLQEAQQDMLEPEEDAGATSSDAASQSLEEIDEKATEMQEPSATSESGTTVTQ
ncbi:MAG: YbaY family lipoprotein [Onishia taeanensis]|uniref:YbaY family lipoprotein n=1 Tax=Onishia taeanensis TaxID=284577 RepID=UPI003C7AA1E9